MTKQYNSKQTIETVITISTKLFTEKGFDKTSMQDIANAANISKGAIYHHFKSKEEILTAVKKRQSQSILPGVEKWIEDTTNLTAKEKLVALLEESLFNPDMHNLDAALSTCTKSPDFVVSYMHECVETSAPILSKIIKEGKEDGTIITDFPDECAETFLLLLNIWCDPSIFACDSSRLISKLKFLQHMMKSLGMDIISPELIEQISTFLEKLYRKDTVHE